MLPGQRSELRIYDVTTGSDVLVYETTSAVIEAPNWSVDGHWLVINRDGLLYRVSTDGGEPELIATGELDDSNNDHVLSADGAWIYASSQDGHIYEVAIEGGTPRRVTDPEDGILMRYLHGISPDGAELAFIGAAELSGEVRYNIYTAQVSTGEVRALSALDAPHDGAEYHPSGELIYFNSERASVVAGHAQLFRMDRSGGTIEQLTDDERVNWFPHVSPDGLRLVYLSYPAGTAGHPANLPVELRIATPDLEHARTVVRLFGGQGTINVNSWAPDSTRFAYVAYPVAGSEDA
ncbi:biopolymer transporter Tol [Mycetocola tolaasinivorans]|uniref:Biopolymer transporter Tol n=1 Tax=Mycetocola tolaasinivorans TaxID=76635 RepID=A0A3L7A2Q2_9MICO|nr:biopolymer transporter Tol [Mycetocola tolaasinivorans]